MSKEQLKEEHIRLSSRHKQLEAEWEQVTAIFQKLSQTYEESKGSFSTGRYGQLKDMIKGATSDDNLQRIRCAIQGPTSSSGGVSSLLNKAKELSSAGEAQAQTAEAKAPAKSGKMSSFMKKLKNVTGFSDEPIRDEDVMSESELKRDNDRKKRIIQRLVTQFSKAQAILEKLKEDYEASKSRAPPKRYQELKDMIKATVAEKL
ncbi:hypothetical protein PoB_002748200 [Plakobranchus ocellatus]|uniref:Uncharacterized protein n=1 Tax=Plakobranchus ocellatus TaxID=259542 RepID=A0AAV4A257_9GAST|nr:hypothetical protein PoB_002748200 [Plakobranchus ocellatus]